MNLAKIFFAGRFQDVGFPSAKFMKADPLAGAFAASVGAVEKTASGAVASFTTALAKPLKSLVAQIEPIQDLHGMPYPYPAGVTANLIPDGTDTTNGYVSGKCLNADGTETTNSDLYISEYFAVTAGETYTWSSTGNPNAPSICFYDANKDYISGEKAAQALPKTITAPSGAVYARCTQYTLSYGQILQFESGSTATTPMYYSNICPISGHTGADITRVGHNLFDENGAYEANKFIDATGSKRSSTGTPAQNLYTQKIRVLPGVYYTVSGKGASKGIIRIAQYNAYDVFITRNVSSNSAAPSITVTPDAKCAYFLVNPDVTLSSLQVEFGSTATDFVPYHGTTIPIDWTDEAGTVYGGSLDVTTGVLTVTHASVDLGTLTWGKGSVVFIATNSVHAAGLSTQWVLPNLLCSQYKTVTPHAISRADGDKGITNTTDGRSISIQDSAYSEYNATEFKAAMSGVQLVYPLADAYRLQIQLDPVTIATLRGQNNIWSDAGDVTVTYLDKR